MQMEKIFDVIECTEGHKASFTTFILKREAKHWWRSFGKTLQVEDDEPDTWTIFL